MLAFVNAVGATILPVFVFPRKKPSPQLSADGPIGCLPIAIWLLANWLLANAQLGLFHESGWMTADNFFAALVHFQSYVGATKERPVLLLMDNHVSHMDFPVNCIC